MALSTIRGKVGGGAYSSAGEIAADFALIAANCAAFNLPGSTSSFAFCFYRATPAASDTHALLAMSTDGMPLAQLVGNTTTWSYTSDVALVNASVHMSLPEAMTWHTLLLGADRYLEWGSGGSTVMASWLSLRDELPRLVLHSIESSPAYIDLLRLRFPVVRKAEGARHLQMHIPDIGPTREWGNPANWSHRTPEEKVRIGRSYAEAVGGDQCCFDLILVDGRFRVACALHALRLAHNRTVVLVHDAFRGSRMQHKDYHWLWESGTYDLVPRRETMAVLRPARDKLDWARQSGARFQERLEHFAAIFH